MRGIRGISQPFEEVQKYRYQRFTGGIPWFLYSPIRGSEATNVQKHSKDWDNPTNDRKHREQRSKRKTAITSITKENCISWHTFSKQRELNGVTRRESQYPILCQPLCYKSTKMDAYPRAQNFSPSAKPELHLPRRDVNEVRSVKNARNRCIF